MNHIHINPETTSACCRALNYNIAEMSASLRRFPPDSTEAGLLSSEMLVMQQAFHAITTALPVSPEKIESLTAELQAVKAERDSLRAALEPWQDISTAPEDAVCWFWIIPLSADEAIHDTSGNPIVGATPPRAEALVKNRWGCMYKATHWKPYVIPTSPTDRESRIDGGAS